MVTAKERLYEVLLRAASRRGIPMVLAVVDERPVRVSWAPGCEIVKHGVRLAEEAEVIQAEMCAGMLPDDEGATISVLSVVADGTLAVAP